ncbi:hypothetical protein SAMN05720766_101275 [Fibrobacter sp. UWH9]|uniref:hypothetical protein n=1 Tax=unclassified Fibrobacter TaxID=2634177 RepID=UPI000921890E|nr:MULTISPECIES: hypothetical protein [unclassified Fibrobacter]MCQ2088743.1 hypothetical protein [Fibrobacter sp.]SHG35319.1 hypothetical protein SAMN05720766_101275 [Fibrobacter sp. UWH9]SHK32009.1 hypothetical protein SAMN05720764_101154 [Fibrobacter sp. UWH5]
MKTLELLPPDTILASVQKRAEELLIIIEEKMRSLSKAPAGRIKLIRRGGNIHCYHVTSSAKPAGKYIPVSEQKFIKALIQKEYDQTVLAELQYQLKLIDNFIKKYNPSMVRELFGSRGELRRGYISPVTLSDEDYAARWLAQSYKCKSFREGEPEFLTSRGERVRSKSEMIIADILAKNNIPYKYELPQQMKAAGGKLIPVYPDFTCVNLRTRQEFLWEHLGRMDDSDYSMKTVMKLRTYSKNDFIPGKNLILTMECDGIPLDRKEVEALVKTFLR